MSIVLIQSTDGDLLDVMSVGAAVKQLADHDISHLVLSVTDLSSDDVKRKMVEFNFSEPVGEEELFSILTFVSPQYESKEPMASGGSWASCLFPEEGVDIYSEFDD